MCGTSGSCYWVSKRVDRVSSTVSVSVDPVSLGGKHDLLAVVKRVSVHVDRVSSRVSTC